jgi:hypothetical protein
MLNSIKLNYIEIYCIIYIHTPWTPGTEAAEPFHDVGHSEFALEQRLGRLGATLTSMIPNDSDGYW